MTVVAAVRVRPAPPLEPPFDDERSPQSWLIPHADQLALDWSAKPPPPSTSVDIDAVTARDAPASPAARAATRRYLTQCLEILNGYRAAGQVRRLATQSAADMVIEQLADGRARLAAAARRLGHGAPRILVGLGRVRICEPRAGIAEVAAVLRGAGRAWALAFRLEEHDGCWLCTAVRLV